MQSVGTKIRKLRELQDLTQESVAAQLGMSQTNYGKIERGETDITYSNLKKIAECLNLDVVSLLSFDSGMVIHKVNESQSGGQAGFVINHGLNDKERELYERKVQLMQQEIEFLRILVKQYTIKPE
ncbi:MAG: XRE family transcriptional regulator [Runella slithyformis]|nr:MAG: XRE family transcriptional regulator [Runella slithyformis]TAF29804.1 MAG: XRE family transcriptional regulator [Runella slithyformis]TAF48845.1 MAG: XRE family transcriptional regulator [Runella slithyformis]TAF83428.1 MAG: XRE family transcriptional regulator [Runella slithyformis]